MTDMPTYRDLKQQAAALDAQIRAARTREKQAIIESMREQIALYDITERDLFSKRTNQVINRAPPPAKFRNPRTGETWSGRGREPEWIRNEDRSMFRISQ
ncbi:H-NS family nucleoid-associated regulatory protein [Burkholderia territorii]|uniref:H-NS histone family protein n=1 Tax=Burkholderia territorii TaxID=1503055 RepID=UPI000A6D85E8|nr:H-NS histone family protein [Burkholderia territorii]